ncbi:MAG: hypothetical protein L6Q98_22870 [Anaerolineae bacterium]|nr:hypothetical protein [Anaerolineae bacterium]NUQ06516.1 hypothetical protein [Anaerolineae bacterium]
MSGLTNSIPTLEESLEIFPGLYQEWSAERSIVVYRPVCMSQALISAWTAAALATLQAWDRRTPYLALHDLSAGGVSTLFASMTNYDMLNIGVTPGGKIRAESFLNEHPGFMARIAIAFNSTLSGHIGRALVNYYTDNHPAIQYKSYYNRDRSLYWLAAHLVVSDGESVGV